MSLTVAGATALAAGLAAAGQAAAIGGQAAANTRVAKLQNQFNIDMWNRTNEYNSPQAQMQRLQDAGLNPNLIYGNVNTGNTTPAQQVAPQAPDIQRGMREVTKAFNVENLMMLDAQRRRANAEATNAEVDAFRNRAQLEAERHLGYEYAFDPAKGQFVQLPADVVWLNNYEDQRHKPYLMQMLANNYYRGSLIPYRQSLLEHQKNYLVPQISMANYEAKYFPQSFWIGQGSKITSAVSDLGGLILKFPKFGKNINAPRQYTSPGGRSYYY